MDRINRWKLADELTVYQIALLIAGYDPSEFEEDHPRLWQEQVRQEISPYLNAIKNAARSKKFEFNLTHLDNGINGPVEIDWLNSTVDIDSLCEWMRLRNFSDGFFIENEGQVDKLADAQGEFYAPKLAAAVRGWKEVTSDPKALNGKTPKKALEVWLRMHANEYGLTNKDGLPNELGIEEVCKVANWKPAGGASPTPVAKPTPTVAKPTPPEGKSNWTRKVRPSPPTPLGKQPARATTARPSDIDEDIPF